MRALLVTLAAATLGGCVLPPTSFTVVVDSARIDARDAAGKPWCPGTTPLVSSVATTISGLRADTPPGYGLAPAWGAATLDAGAADLEGGVRVTLTGRCGAYGADFPIGSVTIYPHPYDGEVIVVALGAAEVHLHLDGLATDDSYSGCGG